MRANVFANHLQSSQATVDTNKVDTISLGWAANGEILNEHHVVLRSVISRSVVISPLSNCREWRQVPLQEGNSVLKKTTTSVKSAAKIKPAERVDDPNSSFPVCRDPSLVFRANSDVREQEKTECKGDRLAQI